MSDISPGPGWWQASDGKWYPPQSAPGVAQPPVPQQPSGPQQGQLPQQGQAFPQTPPEAWQQPQQPQQPGFQQPEGQQYQATPPEKEGMSGCLKAFIIFFVICAVLVVGVGACTVLIADDVTEAIDGVVEEIDDAVAEAERVAEEAERAAEELNEVPPDPDGDTLGGTTGQVVEDEPETATTAPPEPVPATTAAPTSTQEPSTVVLSPNGLVIVDAEEASTRLNFGTDQQLVVDVLSAALGEEPIVSNGSAECPNGQAIVASWPELNMDFDENGSFLSWKLSPGSTLTDENEIGLGSTRTALDEAFLPAVDEDSTLGTEFYGETTLSGLLTGPDQDDTIDALWAGLVCVFR